jgi:hypothetical protein
MEGRHLRCETPAYLLRGRYFRDGDPGSQVLPAVLRKGLPRNGIHAVAGKTPDRETGCSTTTLDHDATTVAGRTAAAAATRGRWQRTPILTPRYDDGTPTGADHHADRRTIPSSRPSLSAAHRTVSQATRATALSTVVDSCRPTHHSSSHTPLPHAWDIAAQSRQALRHSTIRSAHQRRRPSDQRTMRPVTSPPPRPGTPHRGRPPLAGATRTWPIQDIPVAAIQTCW